MPRILIVESNPASLHAPLRAAGGLAYGEAYAQVFSACRADVELTILAPYEGEATPELSGYDGVAFSGSSVAWSTQDARVEPLAAAMRAAFAAGIPVVGSCNGMQLAATVLGGACAASPNGREDGLARDIRLTPAGRAHAVMAGRRDGFAVPCVHRDEVVQLPNGAVVLAGNAHSPVQAFSYDRDGVRFVGMQYHPECDVAFMGKYMGQTGGMKPDAAADLARADQDADAATRLGVRQDDLVCDMRRTELRNWVNAL